ncbi:hypothetical protein PRtIB026_A31040 [Pseudomonas sp. RtIB026]|uniref:hypothetical protein n=1 Tax=Pseudomonas sp. RtIB026 TaxID=2749999 RepID=UPI001940DA8F|nr:hypothetical protein [Pseudomonas sp. RtIB026]BCJ07167.1 hypothetical protein PRtIB026_A31040 [Pseudomonas sp. RtIB026]
MNHTSQMVSAPSELLEQALDAAAAVGMQDVADELDRILTPAPNQPHEVAATPVDIIRFVANDQGMEEHDLGEWVAYGAHAETVARLREGVSKHWKVVCDQRAEINTLRAQLAIARTALQKIMHATDDSQDDGAHHKNAYSIAEHAVNNMNAACRHLNVAPRSTITDGKLIGYFCKDCGSPSASTELSAPEYPRVEIVRAHEHSCASCKEGADYGPCDCGAIVDGVAVKVDASVPVERADPGRQVPLSRIREAMEFSAAGHRAAELQIGETHLRVTYHGIKWHHDRRHCNRWEPLAIEEFDDLLCFALKREVQP